MTAIKDIQEEIIDDVSFFEDWSEKYTYIIETGKALPAMDDAFKTEENKIKGCQSQVWLHAEEKDGKLYFQADSDALIVKGLIALLVRVYSGHTAEEILSEEPYFIDEIGMKQHLSPTRSNGLLQMVKQIKYYALAFNSKQS